MPRGVRNMPCASCMCPKDRGGIEAYIQVGV